MKQRIYLDYNATAPMRPEVRDVVGTCIEKPLNASSAHAFGREAHKFIEEARERVAALVGAEPSQVIFNSGATEGNNTVLKSFEGQRILVSAIEHPSVLEAAPKAEQIPVTPEGTLDLAALEDLLKAEPVALVSLMLVNNETGAIQPVAEAAALAKKHGSFVHCDAVQAAGRIPINIQELCVDFLTLSAHKIGGPQGVGALVMGFCGEPPVLLYGGGQEKKARPGTENVAGIAGFGVAAQLSAKGSKAGEGSEPGACLEAGLPKALGNKEIIIHAQNAPRVGGVTLFSISGVKSETVLMALDLEGVAVSNGSACSSGTTRRSHVLKAMGVSDEIAAGAVRVSTGWGTTSEDIETFLSALTKIYSRINK